MATFLTIRETARAGLLSEHHLRVLLKRGKLPGIYTGNRFKVNIEMLTRMLESESAANAGGSHAL